MAIIKSQEIKSVREDVEEREHLCTIGGNVNWSSNYGKQYGDSSKDLILELPYDPTIPLLGIYLKKTKILTGKNVPPCSLQHYLQ